MNHAFGAPLLALAVLAGGPVPPPPTLPANPEPAADEPAIDVAIDTSSLDPDLAVRLQSSLAEAINAALQRTEHELVEDGTDAKIELSVQMPDVEHRDYALSLAVAHGDTRATVIEGIRCSVCSERQVVEQALTLLPAATAWLTAHREEEPPPEPPPPPVETRRLGALGIVGVATLTGGAATMISGGVLVREAPLADTASHRVRGQGVALLGVGGSALLLGVAAAVIDLTVLDRLRRGRRVELGVDASPTSAGLRVSGSF